MPKPTKDNGIASDKKPKSPAAKKSHGDKAHAKTNNTPESPLSSANKKKTQKTTSSLMQFLKKPSDDTAK